MPPAIFSDDEISEVEETQETIHKSTESDSRSGRDKGKGKAIEVDDAIDLDEVRDDDVEEVEAQEAGDDEEEAEELAEDEYIVEKILGHLIDEDGELRLKVKWLGFDKKSDQTWEPERNLIDTTILGEYYESVGGRDAVLSGEKPKKKRGRASASSAAAESSTNGKRRKTAPKSESPSTGTSANHEEFKPPSGSWEDAVQTIDACEGAGGQIHVYLHWANGQKTKHPLEQVYKRCPQKMLKFYEAHLSITPTTHTKEAATNIILESSKRGRGRPKKKLV